jgi:hypothetical protein
MKKHDAAIEAMQAFMNMSSVEQALVIGFIEGIKAAKEMQGARAEKAKTRKVIAKNE